MSDVDMAQLNRAIAKVARLIHATGEDYWPILDRLEAERDRLLNRKERLEHYLRRDAGTSLTGMHRPARHSRMRQE